MNPKGLFEILPNSALEPWLRHAMQTLLLYADANGGNIFPGIKKFAAHLGVSVRTAQRQLQALRARQLLVRDGYRNRTHVHHADLEKLRSYTTSDTAVSPVKTLTPDTAVSSVRRRRQATPVTTTSDTAVSRTYDTAVSPEVKEINGGTYTGADAPAPLSRSQSMHEPSRPPFRVYVALAKKAESAAMAEGDDSLANIGEHLKRRCAQESLVYDSEIVRRAVDAAVAARQKTSPASLDRRARPHRVVEDPVTRHHIGRDEARQMLERFGASASSVASKEQTPRRWTRLGDVASQLQHPALTRARRRAADTRQSLLQFDDRDPDRRAS